MECFKKISKNELGDCLALSFSETAVAGIRTVVTVGVCESLVGSGVFICLGEPVSSWSFHLTEEMENLSGY